MIFASDLDRTLIYSKKLIDEDIRDIICMEKYNGKEITYMTNMAFEKLKKINEKINFIPVTTRTVEEYERIKKLKELDIKYNITSNGGNIFENGKLDLNWNKSIQTSFGKIAPTIEEVTTKLMEFASDEWLLNMRDADEMFVYTRVDKEKIPKTKFEKFEKWLIERNWSATIHGRKMYLIPNFVNKGRALLEIAKKEDDEDIIAAGDSRMDLDMSKKAKLFIVPYHGEAVNMLDEEDLNVFKVTKQHGIKSSEEILSEVIKDMNI